jgi:methylenetetrahydrofolate--tRNA-(uracil-5-)-methyltransferase
VSPHGPVHVVGGGLAGCEAALQLARLGQQVVLHEMRPLRTTSAHRTGDLAEVVCTNSFKSADPVTASGLLKQELRALGCRLLVAAERCAVPAGAALAVDPDLFQAEVSRLLANEPRVRIVREEIAALDTAGGEDWLVATGPLTSPALQAELARRTGSQGLHFFDAIAPTVTLESLDLSQLFRAARYGRGEADYLNGPLDAAAYQRFWRELTGAERAEVHAFERDEIFPACQPIEEIAASGPNSLAFGPLRPVGLIDPRTGRRPHAVVQLRQENRAGTLYGLVGFQTRLRFGEQKRIFRLLPGLQTAEFVRLGQLHRNFYVDTPRVLDRGFALRADTHVRLAGQITGVEGYVESITSGLVTGWLLAAARRDLKLPLWPPASLIGSLLFGFLFDTTGQRLSPMNVHYGLLPPLVPRPRQKRQRRLAQGSRALAELQAWLATSAVARLLAGGSALC